MLLPILSFEPTLQMVFETVLGMNFYSSLKCKDDWKLFFKVMNAIYRSEGLHVSDMV